MWGSLWRGVVALAVDDEVLRAAAQLADRHGLRGYDAVHLASALSIGPAASRLLTFDVELIEAARAEGLAVAG